MIMEGSIFMSTTISLACILFVTLSWKVLNWVWFNPKRLEKILRKQGFQGNPYKLLYGDSKEKAKMIIEARSKPMSDLSNDHISRTYPFIHHTIKNYGPQSFEWHGPVPIVHIFEPDQMREVLMKINEFQKPKINPIFKVVATGLIQLEGEAWAKHRKLLTPAFHIEKLKLMLEAFSESCNDMIEKWEQMTWETGSCELDVWSYLPKLAADVISRAAFGSSYEEGKQIFELLTEQLDIAIPILNSMYIPGWSFIPTKANRRIMQTDREIRSLLKKIIDDRHKSINVGEKPKDDLLGILLDSNLKANNNNGISLKEVIDECKIFYIAGQETTSSLLVWTLIMLSKHQDWQTRARDEVLNTFGNNIPDFQGLNHLKTVNMILQEVLRLYPSAGEINRTVCEDTKVGNLVLPAGVLVNLPLVYVQHDEKLWGNDAKEFNPDRFRDGISKATSGNMSFFAFGWGPRICIGSNFAMIEAKLALVLILQRFSFELSPSYSHAPSAINTLRPQFGAQIILQKL